MRWWRSTLAVVPPPIVLICFTGGCDELIVSDNELDIVTLIDFVFIARAVN